MGDLNDQRVTKDQLYLEIVMFLGLAAAGGFGVYNGHFIGWPLLIGGVALAIADWLT